jgi:hypothetical protein
MMGWQEWALGDAGLRKVPEGTDPRLALSVVGQIARIKGCRAIGIAGGADKCAWLVEKASFDAAIEHKTENVGERLDALCPDGIDVFFDNVGGPILDEALGRIARGAREARQPRS